MTEHYEHNLYKHVSDIKDAEAVGFSFVNPDKTVFFPYKHTELLPGEIRANMIYSGLCLSDSLSCRSKWGNNPYPVAPGHEIIAEVSEVASDVKDFKKGDKVGFGTMRACCDQCKYCLNNKEPLCNEVLEEKFTYGYHWGGYSTHIQQPAKFFFKLPEKLDIKRAAPLLCAGITVYNPIKQYLKKDFVCAVIGVGGLGHLAVQFLSKLGHKVTGVTTSSDKIDFIKSLGATDVLVFTDEEQYKKHVGKYDFIINTIPLSDNFEKYLNLTAPLGYFCQVGVPDHNEKISFSVNNLVFNELHFVGSLVGSRADINEMLQLCADKEIYPICEHFEFEDFGKALERMEKGKPIFRCVVNCENYSKSHNLYK